MREKYLVVVVDAASVLVVVQDDVGLPEIFQ